MFIIIIVAIFIAFISLSKLNSRISKLEDILSKVEKEKEVIVENIQTKIPTETKTETYVHVQTQQKNDIKEEVHTQDNFAKNLAKFGIAVFVIGIMFFLKYIDSQGLIGPVFKYTAGLFTGVALLGIAEYIKKKNKSYTNLLRGGSFVVLYLTIFIGYTFFNIVNLPITLILTAVVLFVSVIISLHENDLLPFTLGSLGAYVIPFLTGLNTYNLDKESATGILIYILILNLSVLFVSFKKNWTRIFVIGFVSTWSIFASFLSLDVSRNNLFLFATLFGLQYLIIFLSQDFKKSEENDSKNLVILTVSNTVIYSFVFYKLVVDTNLFNYVGYFIALLGLFHFVVYMFMYNKNILGKISLTHLVISILLVSAAVPLQFDGPMVTMIWLIEGAVLSLVSVLKNFKNKPIMYVLSFIAIIAGILHMIAFENYKDVFVTGKIFANTNYIVWFMVFVLINFIAYVWYKTVQKSEDIIFKNEINKVCFALIILGQIMFIGLTANEIRSYGSYKLTQVYYETSKAIEKDEILNGYYSENQEYLRNKENEKIDKIRNQTTFMQIILFIFMTIIYFVIGLIKKNKIIRNMGIVTLAITTILLIMLTWALGPIYRILSFVGLGAALLIISYFYISKKTLMLFISVGLLSLGVSDIYAKSVDITKWTNIANISKLDVVSYTNDQNIYVLPINTDIISSSKKNDLSDIRIIDTENNEIPYVFVKKNENTQSANQEQIDVKVLENSFSKNKQTIVLDTNREGVIYNEINLIKNIDSINFRKKVKVYISDTFLKASSPSWKEIEQKNVIYNYTDKDNFKVEDLDINLSGISSRYVKIEFTDDLDFNKNIKVNNKISVESVKIKYLKTEDKTIGYKVKDYISGNFIFDNLSIYKNIKLLNISNIETKTELIFEGDFNINEILLNINSDENFNRNLIVQGSDNDIDWYDIGSGNIYNIDSPTFKGQKFNINIPTSSYKKIKIIIENNNNKALNIDKTAKVKIQNTGVLLKIENGKNISDLRIIVGNKTETAPVYDLKNTINYFEAVTPEIVKYENFAKNPEYVPTKEIIPFGEKNKIILNIVLLVFILIIGLFGFFWMKKDV